MHVGVLELNDVWDARLEVPPVLDQPLAVGTRSSCRASTGSPGERTGIRCAPCKPQSRKAYNKRHALRGWIALRHSLDSCFSSQQHTSVIDLQYEPKRLVFLIAEHLCCWRAANSKLIKIWGSKHKRQKSLHWTSFEVALQKLIESAKKLADAGITSLWRPPPSDAVSAQGYLPRSPPPLSSPFTPSRIRILGHEPEMQPKFPMQTHVYKLIDHE